jgi:Na+-translocating ferredoxin:NAD+ oxidoreductase subunit B
VLRALSESVHLATPVTSPKIARVSEPDATEPAAVHDATASSIEPETSHGDGAGVALASRKERIAARERNPKWRNPALRIDMSTCINCDTCLRHCPPHFGAIFNFGLDVIIVPELCSGCGKCLPPVCPVDCIVEDPTPEPTPEDWWALPLSDDDPYR